MSYPPHRRQESRLRILLLAVVTVVVGSIETRAAWAQINPGGMPMGQPGGGMPGAQQPAGEEKKEGVGEAAPKTNGLLPTTPALPAPKSSRKKWKLIELNGYYRVRTDWDKDFNLGYLDIPAIGGAPFPRSIGCVAPAVGAFGNTTNRPCGDTLSGTDMRLRLEPTINITEGTSVHIQADALDNLPFGSTPDGIALNGIYNSTNLPPVGAFGSTQGVQQAGINSDRNSIDVKRAWAEVALPIGILKAGRMPNQWGMGIFYNSGGYNPIDGSYNYDADFGDSVDRISFTAQVPGTPLRAMAAVDWDNAGLTSNQTNVNNALYDGHPFTLDNSTETTGFVGVISKIDTPQEFQDTVDRGEVALDYGVYFEYKTADWAENLTGFQIGSGFDAAHNYEPRGLKTYSPDLWAKLGIGPVTIEGEFIAQLGEVTALDEYGFNTTLNIIKTGGAARGQWRGFDNKLTIGAEVGFASGDQYSNTPQGNTNIAYANLLGTAGTDTNRTQFIFNPDYHVDLIMWRFLFGAVTNAVYAKPYISYDITKEIGFKVWNVTSFAIRPVSTPGHDTLYGDEVDADIYYNSGGLHAGISAGVLFPFGAMSHPSDTVDNGGPGFNYGTQVTPNGATITNIGDPGTAYAIQSRLVLSF
jgi:uncharacterized protein (TIGR04551 family)